jgi:hypothetical protein
LIVYGLIIYLIRKKNTKTTSHLAKKQLFSLTTEIGGHMNTTAEHHKHDRLIPIFIDDKKYEIPDAEITGAALRALQPVPADRDLWLEVPGKKDDELIRADKKYDIKAGSHFYTAPSTINPGAR